MERVKNIEVGTLRTDPIVASPISPVSRVVGILKDFEAYEAFVPEGDKIGLVTMRDILGVKNLTTRKVNSITTQVPKLTPVTPVREAARIMSLYRIRAMPIVEKDKLKGQVTALSIANAMKSDAGRVKARDIMIGEPVAVDERDPVAKAKNIMIKKRFDHLPVVSNTSLLGILTSSQIVYAMLPSEGVEYGAKGVGNIRRLDMNVSALMNPHVTVCKPEDGISSVLESMIREKSTCAIVKLWDEAQGIITYRDYVKLLAEPEEKAEIPIYMVGLPEDPFEAESAKTKFIRTINLLKRTFPDIEEARAKIKTKESQKGKERRHYEVSAMIKTSRRRFNYTEEGWELPAIFDLLSDRMRRILAQKPSRRKLTTRRRAEAA